MESLVRATRKVLAPSIGQGHGKYFGSRARPNLTCRQMRRLKDKLKNQEVPEGIDAKILLHKEDTIWTMVQGYVVETKDGMYTAYGTHCPEEDKLKSGDIVRISIDNESEKEAKILALLKPASNDPKDLEALDKEKKKANAEITEVRANKMSKEEGIRKWVKIRS